MTFIINYRDKAGRRASFEIEASDKSAVWPELKKRGITAISIQERTCKSNNRLPSSKLLGRGAIIGSLIALFTGAVIWWMSGEENAVIIQDEKGKKQNTTIKHTPTNSIKKSKSAKVPVANHIEEEYDKANQPAVKLNSQTPSSNVRVITNKVDTATSKSRYDVFEHRVEGELAFLACMPLGTVVIGSRDFDETFMKELNEALISKITINDDDTDETRYYKQAVIDLKKQIKTMLKNGDDIAAALTQTRKELQDLGVYKTQLEIELNRFMSNGDEASDEDVEDFVKAANIMLKEKGIEPFDFNPLTRTIMRHRPLFNSNGQVEDEERSDHE